MFQTVLDFGSEFLMPPAPPSQVVVRCALCEREIVRQRCRVGKGSFVSCCRSHTAQMVWIKRKRRKGVENGKAQATVTMTPAQKRIAQELGGGSVAAGMRRALNIVYREYGVKTG